MEEWLLKHNKKIMIISIVFLAILFTLIFLDERLSIQEEPVNQEKIDNLFAPFLMRIQNEKKV